MNFLLETKLTDIQDIILEFLFENKDDITKWNNDKKILINKKFNSLLQGDWSRYKSKFINLNNLIGKK